VTTHESRGRGGWSTGRRRDCERENERIGVTRVKVLEKEKERSRNCVSLTLRHSDKKKFASPQVIERVYLNSYSNKKIYEPASSSQTNSSQIKLELRRAKIQASYERVTSHELFARPYFCGLKRAGLRVCQHIF
jgi:hypothetical protein